MEKEKYLALKSQVENSGWGEDIEFYKNCHEPTDPDYFFHEYSWVVVSSGIKNQIARKIYNKILDALDRNQPFTEVFFHSAKASAMQSVYDNRARFFEAYQKAPDKLAYLETLPFIGPITKYHLAKNFVMDVCKPDRHLVRISEMYNTTPEELCRKLSEETGDKVAIVDVVLFRAGNMGWI